MSKSANTGTGIALGLSFGCVLWLVTDNIIFLSVGLVFGIVFGGMFSGGTFGGATSDADRDNPDESVPPSER